MLPSQPTSLKDHGRELTTSYSGADDVPKTRCQVEASSNGYITDIVSRLLRPQSGYRGRVVRDSQILSLEGD